MIDRQVFEEMINVYEKAIPEMEWLGEIDWGNAARETQERIDANSHGNLKESSMQLARECHADLQGYIEVRFGANVMEAESCYGEGCFDLYVLGQYLIQMGGFP